jgi:hypothetical protein
MHWVGFDLYSLVVSLQIIVVSSSLISLDLTFLRKCLFDCKFIDLYIYMFGSTKLNFMIILNNFSWIIFFYLQNFNLTSMATLPVIYSQWSIIYWKGYQRKQEVGAQVWNGVEPILKKKKSGQPVRPTNINSNNSWYWSWPVSTSRSSFLYMVRI